MYEGGLLHLCEKSAVQNVLLKHELINLSGIRLHISEQVLDTTTPLQDFQQYVTKYAWAALERKGIFKNMFKYTNYVIFIAS